jgi:YidC/Oxa1 family membrane protein insertase
MALYKVHKVNPMSGFLPLLIQMPILILLFQTLRKFEYLDPSGNISGGFLWIANQVEVMVENIPTIVAGLAAPEQLIHLPGNGIFNIQALGIMPFLIGGSMWYQQKMTTAGSGASGGSAEQTQKMMTIMMPLMIGFMSFSLPSGLTLYWLTSTLLGIGQQYLINKKMPTAVVPIKSLESGKKEKPVEKENKKETKAKEDFWIPGYQNTDNKNTSKHSKKIKKYKRDK